MKTFLIILVVLIVILFIGVLISISSGVDKLNDTDLEFMDDCDECGNKIGSNECKCWF